MTCDKGYRDFEPNGYIVFVSISFVNKDTPSCVKTVLRILQHIHVFLLGPLKGPSNLYMSHWEHLKILPPST